MIARLSHFGSKSQHLAAPCIPANSTPAITWIALLTGVLSLFNSKVRGDDGLSLTFQGQKWTMETARDDAVTVHAGRPAIQVVGPLASSAYLKDVEFTDGMIEADLAAGPRGMPGIAFRRQEGSRIVDRIIFLRVPASGLREDVEVEQAIVTRRDGTQIFLRLQCHDDVADWFHVKLVVRGSGVQVYVDDSATPIFSVENMLDGTRSGNIGLWGHQEFYASNFRFQPKQ